jgi:hypothetical protein
LGICSAEHSAMFARTAGERTRWHGIEAHVIFRDIWERDDDEARQVSLWMARVLAEAAAKESRRLRR